MSSLVAPAKSQSWTLTGSNRVTYPSLNQSLCGQENIMLCLARHGSKHVNPVGCAGEQWVPRENQGVLLKKEGMDTGQENHRCPPNSLVLVPLIR